MKFRRYYIFVLVSVIILIILYFSLNEMTKEYNDEISGIKYQLGNNIYEEKIKLKIVGIFKRKLFGNCTFIGNMYIEDIELSCSKFDDNDMALLIYVSDGYAKTFGQVFVNNDLGEFTVLYNGWSNDSGVMITVPAKDREEALRISNQLMGKFLKYNNIEDLF